MKFLLFGTTLFFTMLAMILPAPTQSLAQQALPTAAAAATAACEFGGGACGVGRVVGLGQHVVPIPTAPFFAPPVIAPAGTPAHILVDMWLVQQVLI